MCVTEHSSFLGKCSGLDLHLFRYSGQWERKSHLWACKSVRINQWCQGDAHLSKKLEKRSLKKNVMSSSGYITFSLKDHKRDIFCVKYSEFVLFLYLLYLKFFLRSVWVPGTQDFKGLATSIPMVSSKIVLNKVS